MERVANLRDRLPAGLVAGLVLVISVAAAVWVSTATLRIPWRTWLVEPTDNLGTLLSASLVGVAAVLAYSQWAADQRWKRMEALMERIMAFGDTPGSRNAMMMLTTRERDVPLWDREKPECRYERVTWNEVAHALIPGNLIDYEYNKKEIAIRDSLEDFLGRLTHLGLYREAGLLKRGEAAKIVDTWKRRFGALSSDSIAWQSLGPDGLELARNLRLYIEWRGMKEVQRLFWPSESDFLKQIADDKAELKVALAAEASRNP